MFRELWQVLRRLMDILPTGVANITQVITRVQGLDRTEVQVYLAGLRRLALISIFFPIPLLIIGFVGGLGWLVALVGIFWAICTLLLSTLAGIIPLLIEVLKKIADGVPIETLKKIADTLKGVGHRYVHLVQWTLLTELVFTLLVAVFPIQNNLKALPVIAIAAAILGTLAIMGEKTVITKKLIKGFATITLIVFTISFFLPQDTIPNLQKNIKEKGLLKGSLVGTKETLWKSEPPPPAKPPYEIVAEGEFIGKGTGGEEAIVRTKWFAPTDFLKGDFVTFHASWVELDMKEGGWKRFEGPEITKKMGLVVGNLPLRVPQMKKSA